MKLDIPVGYLIVAHGLCVVIGLVIAYGITYFTFSGIMSSFDRDDVNNDEDYKRGYKEGHQRALEKVSRLLRDLYTEGLE